MCLPTASPVYNFLTNYVLASCLLRLLLLNINLPAIFRLGPTALGSMAVGALGIGVGAVVAWSQLLGPLTAAANPGKGIGALSASWIRRQRANMVAVKGSAEYPGHHLCADDHRRYGRDLQLDGFFGVARALARLHWDAWVHDRTAALG